LNAASFFSPDYATARSRIRQAAARLDCQLEAHPISETGPHGEELTIDVAILPGNGRGRTLVVSSGIHGVEGFFGSAVQLALLEEFNARMGSLPALRCVLLHGLNPYGFAWRRRVNEANVDLNRNMLLEGEQFAGSPPGYAELDQLLNPTRAPSRWEPVRLKFLSAIARHGMTALKQTVAGGQYDYPRGLFYGGDRPSQLSAILSTHFSRWLGDSSQVMHLDFHTGLGAHGSCKLLVDDSLGEAHMQRLDAWFGPGSHEGAHSHAVAYAVRGSFGRWCGTRNPSCDYLYAAAEFGTYKPTRVVAGLRAENQAHHWGRPEDASTERAKHQLVELFCPESNRWRAQVLQHGRQLVTQAIHGLLSTR
jgi:hypothetical protein